MKVFNLFCIIALIAACSSSTHIQQTWTDPSLLNGTVLPFKKVLVIAVLNDEINKRYAEDKIAENFKKRIAVPSYKYLGPEDGDKKQIEEKMLKDSFDGIVTMRLLRVDKIVTSAPAQTALSTSEWYTNNYSDSLINLEDKLYIVETNFYSVPSYKMLWTGTTGTLNPEKFDKALNEIIVAIKSEMARQGLMK